MSTHDIRQILSWPVIVASLGYFVDIYDLLLFSIVRIPSLKELGYTGQALMDNGVLLLNVQMGGMLLGGILWGILGDKKGRLQIMFASIFIYSVANILNGMATNIEEYAILRFIAGVGLAGELGAGITLVSEILPKHLRGYGTMIIPTVGVSGAILANVVANNFNWHTAFYIGGALGLILLVLRVLLFESGMYEKMAQKNDLPKGDFLSLFTNSRRFSKFMKTILIGIPTWFVVGVLITFSPEFAKALNVQGAVTAGNAVMYVYIGLVLGDLTSGFLSQYFRSRKKIIAAYILLTSTGIIWYFMAQNVSAMMFYIICVFLGVGIGYWAVFVTVAAEQFGTNLRATVATSVPNIVRGFVVPITTLFVYAKAQVGLMPGAMAVGALCIVISLVALYFLEETYHKELDYIEEG